MKKVLLATVALSALVLAGCGAANTASPSATTSPVQTTNTSTTNAGTSNNTTSSQNNTAADNQATDNQTTTTSNQAALKQQEIDLTILPGGKLGSDGKMHDTYSPSNITVVQGVPVKLTIYNYDDMKHSYTATDLNLNVQANPSKKDGVPGVTTVTFTPSKAGDFTWRCIDPCDLENGGWAMSHMGFMEGTIHVVPYQNKQYIDLTIKDGLKYASADGKLHDAYSPADFTVQAGIPVQVTVTNYDTGSHSMTSSALGLNQMMKAATKEGVPAVTTFTFTPQKAGKFNWHCIVPCDGGPNGWAMSHDGYMDGYITVVN